MKLNLTELVNLKVSMNRKLSQLQSERNSFKFVTVEKPEDAEYDPTLVEDISEKILQIIRDLAKLEAILSFENSKKSDLYGITILEGISYIKRMRNELSEYQEMSKTVKKTLNTSRWEGGVGYKMATFDPETFKNMAVLIEKEINKISRELDKRNFTTEVEVDFADKYM